MKRFFIPVSFYIVAALFFFREFPASHFDHITGDMGDSRFNLSILEHWHLFFTGQAAFASPQFFYPLHGVLGFSDADFLLALPYSAFRLFIADIYLAFECTVIFIHFLGFTAIYLLLRRWLTLERYSAAFGALLFAISNIYYDSAYAVQFRAVSFVPLILLLVFIGIDLRSLAPRRAVLICSVAAALAALLFFTSYYVAWFFFLALLIAAVCVATAALFGYRPIADLRGHARFFIAPTVVFFVFLIPFFVTYLPRFRETGDRPYGLALLFCSTLADFVNVGVTNVAWGWTIRGVFAPLQARPNYWEFERGWPVIMAIVFLFTGIVSLIEIWRTRRGTISRRTGIAGALFAIVIICWLLQLKRHEHSLWWLVYHVVPGATAIRAPVRFDFVLNVGVVVVCTVGLERLAGVCSRHLPGKALAIAPIILLCAGMVIEQANTVQSHVVDRAERQWLQGMPPPPTSCRVFYVTPSQGRPALWDNIDAMLLSEEVSLPTVNGYSGWFPKGWDLMTDPASYPSAVRRWAVMNGVVTGLCAADIAEKNWQPDELGSMGLYRLGEKIDFRKGGNSNQYAMDGWGDEEPGGRWTIGTRAQLSLSIPAPVHGRVQLAVECKGFNPGQSPASTVTIEVNGYRVFHKIIPSYAEPSEFTAEFEASILHAGSNTVAFLIANPRRPSDFGSPDTRILGISVQSVLIEAAN